MLHRHFDAFILALKADPDFPLTPGIPVEGGDLRVIYVTSHGFTYTEPLT